MYKLLLPLLLMGVVFAVACGGTCENYCEGGLFYVWDKNCSKTTFEGCPLGTACVDGATKCYPEPIEPCASRGVVIPEGGRNCDASGTRPGTCQPDGFMLWDADGAVCTDDRGGSSCEYATRGADGEGPFLAECAISRLIKRECTFTADQPSYSCQNNLLIRCSEVGAWVIDLDCSAEGKECRNAQCVSK